MHANKLRKATLAIALMVGTSFLTSCASVVDDPVSCGVIGSVVGGLAGAGLAAALSSDNVTGPVILGTTIGAGIGAFSAYTICKYPTFESADAKARKRRIETSPAAEAEPADEAPAEEAPSEE